MIDDTPLPFDLSAVCRKKLTVDFNGGPQSFAKAEFATIRERLFKIGARVIEHAARIHLPASFPEARLFRAVALRLAPSTG